MIGLAIVHYNGSLGEFDYDDTVWEVCVRTQHLYNPDRKPMLFFKDSQYHGGVISIPSGATDLTCTFVSCKFNGDTTIVCDNKHTISSCNSMFEGCSVKGDLTIVGLITDKKTTTESMFLGLRASGKVIVKNELYTRDICAMFTDCNLKQFDILVNVVGNDYNVWDADGQFFSLDSESVSKIIVHTGDYYCMYTKCDLYSENYTFNLCGHNFKCMLADAVLPSKYLGIHIVPDDIALETNSIDLSDLLCGVEHCSDLIDLHLDIPKDNIRLLDGVNLERALSYCCAEDVSLESCWKHIHFSEEFFLLPDETLLKMFYFKDKSIDEVFEKGNPMPPYIRNSGDIKDILRQFNKAYDEYVSNGEAYEQCKVELAKLLRERKTIKESRELLSSKYPFIDIDVVFMDCITQLSSSCSSALQGITTIPVGKEQCVYTIGEIRKKLREAGYPGDIVDKCVFEFIDDQYISI